MKIDENWDPNLAPETAVKSNDYIGATAFALRNEMPTFVLYLNEDY